VGVWGCNQLLLNSNLSIVTRVRSGNFRAGKKRGKFLNGNIHFSEQCPNFPIFCLFFGKQDLRITHRTEVFSCNIS